MTDVVPKPVVGQEKKKHKRRLHKKKGLGMKKMPRDGEEKEELRREVVEHVNLTRNRTKTLKHFMAQGYPNFLIRKLMGDLFKNPNPEKKAWVVDPEKKETLKQELFAFMIQQKLEKKEYSDQLKALVKHLKPKGYSKGQIRSAHHQFAIRMARRGKPKTLKQNQPTTEPESSEVRKKPESSEVRKKPESSPMRKKPESSGIKKKQNQPTMEVESSCARKDESPSGSDSGVENVEPSKTDHSDTVSPKRKSLDSGSGSPSKVSKMTPVPKTPLPETAMAGSTPKAGQMSAKKLSQKKKKQALRQSTPNVAVKVDTNDSTVSNGENLSQESVSTPFPQKPEGYINRKTARKLKRESLEAKKSGLSPKSDPSSNTPKTVSASSPTQETEKQPASPLKDSLTPSLPKLAVKSENCVKSSSPEKEKLPVKSPEKEKLPVKSPEKEVSPVKSPIVPIVVASPKLETSEHPSNGNSQDIVAKPPQLKRGPSPVKSTPAKQVVSPKKQTLKSSLKKKGKNQVNDSFTPKEEKRVSFGKNQIKEFNRKDTPKGVKNRETDLIKFTPIKDLMGFETPTAKKMIVNPTTNRPTNEDNPSTNEDVDDCPQLISVLDESTPQLKAANCTPVEPLVPKKKKKTPPKISPRMTRSAAKKKALA